MSRIGKLPVPVPSGVDVTLDGNDVTVTGPKGELRHSVHPAITVRQEDGTLVVTRSTDEREDRSLHGLTRALLANMVMGVSEGYRRQLDIVGVGYRAALLSPTELRLQLGYSHDVFFAIPDGITAEVPSPTRIILTGADKQQIGQVAANIRKLRKPEPYKGKGIRYSDEVVRRKAGKAAGK